MDTSLADQIEDIVKRYDYVSFAELPRKLNRDDLGGDVAIHLTGRPNCVFWSGMSKEYADAVLALMSAKRIYPHPSDFLVYVIDGAVPKMEMAKRPPRGDYKNPHWLPIVLRTVPVA